MSQHSKNHSGDAKPLVFVVDDEPMLLELASANLEPLGFTVQTFRDPDTAVQSFAATPSHPVLVITDYAMHTMNGLELIRAVRRINPQQKILLVSGTVDAEVYSDSADKPNRFLAKPYQARQLVEVVKAMVRI